MNLSTHSVKRPVTILMIYALILGICASLIPSLGIDMFPSMSMPILSIQTSYSGAGPGDVEENVTKQIEKAVASIEGLKGISSTSSEGRSSVTLEFGYDVDLEEAKSDIESQLTSIRDSLPDGTSTPTVRKFDMSQMPILRLIVRGDRDLEDLKEIAEDILQPRLERVSGVASAEVTGGKTRIVEVKVSLNRLEAYGIALTSLLNLMSSQNLLLSGGTFEQSGREYQIRTEETFTSLAEIEDIVVKQVASDGSGLFGGSRNHLVRLKDVADISVGYSESSTEVYINGEPGLYLMIQNESDSNSVKVARSVHSVLEELNGSLPTGVTVEILSDDTAMIESTLNMVYKNALQGAILAMVILLIFLRGIKSTFIIGLAIPIGIIITLAGMAFMGLTLNMLTLTGLILGLGMTVDGSIVILENIHRYRERGAKPATAAVLGSQEMITAITASTLTTLCVFIPVLIYGNSLEQMGQMFKELVITVIISLTSSLFVAMTLVPVLAGPVLRLDTRIQKPLKNKFIKALDKNMESGMKGLENLYGRALKFCMGNRILVLGVVLSILILSLVQFTSLGFNLFVRSDSDDSVEIQLTLPLGTPKERTKEVLDYFQSIIKEEVRGYNTITMEIGGSRGPGGLSSANYLGSLRISLPTPEKQIDNPSAIISKLRPLFSDIPGAEVSFSAGRRMGSSSAVEILLETESMENGLRTAEAVKNALIEYLPQVIDPEISLSSGVPDLRIRIDRNRAYSLGVSVYEIASTVRTALYGSTVTSYRGLGEDMDVVVKLKDPDKASLEDLKALFVTGNYGTLVPLSNVVTFEEGTAPSQITRENRVRIIKVTGDLSRDMAVTEMQAIVENTITSTVVPEEGVTISFSGESEDIAGMTGALIIVALFAAFLVFAIMASQFESLVDPFIIFFSIPLIIIGVVIIYWITGEPFSLFSAVGLVALMGIVVNNGIVLVDYTNTLRARGLPLKEACIEAGKHRLRPILMTTLTTILSMVPLAFFTGEGAESVQPIAITIVGGLSVSSLMTLFVTPVIYSLLNFRKSHGKKAEKREEQLRMLLDSREG